MDTRQRAIPTRFDGFRFRSMLEARWAVFFNALDIKYLYEPQGFVTDGRPYLPDFCLLLGEMVWAEVKPAFDTDPDGVERWKSFVRGRNGKGVLLTDMTSRPGPFLLIGTDSCGDFFETESAQWCACPAGYHFMPDTPLYFNYCKLCFGPDAGLTEGTALSADDYLQEIGYHHRKIAAAYELARSYQFDRR